MDILNLLIQLPAVLTQPTHKNLQPVKYVDQQIIRTVTNLHNKSNPLTWISNKTINKLTQTVQTAVFKVFRLICHLQRLVLQDHHLIYLYLRLLKIAKSNQIFKINLLKASNKRKMLLLRKIFIQKVILNKHKYKTT